MGWLAKSCWHVMLHAEGRAAAESRSCTFVRGSRMKSTCAPDDGVGSQPIFGFDAFEGTLPIFSSHVVRP